jgi:hypothetical protein
VAATKYGGDCDAGRFQLSASSEISLQNAKKSHIENLSVTVRHSRRQFDDEELNEG